jgi:amidase
MLIAEDAQALLLGAEEDAAIRSALARVAGQVEPVGAVTVAPEGLASWQAVYRTLQGFEAWQAHGAWLTQRQPRLGPGTAERFAAASRVTAADDEAARARRAQIAARVRGLVGDDTVLALPTMPTAAPRMDAAEAEFEQFRSRALSMLCIAGLAGLPQISLPLTEVGGLPLGVSLIGPPGRDKALIALARRVLAG